MKMGFVFVGFLAAFAQSVIACKFEPSPFPERVLVDSVAHGTQSAAIFQIEREIKGLHAGNGARIRVNSSVDTCGLHFVEGEVWLIVGSAIAKASGPMIFTDATSGSLRMAYRDGRQNSGNVALIAEVLEAVSPHRAGQ
jgi:hypothetical protein